MLIVVPGWKGADSMILLRWLLRVLQLGPVNFAAQPPARVGRLQDFGAEKSAVFGAVNDGCVALIRYFQIVHKCGLFLTAEDGASVVAAVTLFCSVYTHLAYKFLAWRVCRFHLEPSLHTCKHIGHQLELTILNGATVLISPAAWLCEQSEDFVGRISRITRRVSARLTGQRTLQRYLLKMYLELQRLGI